MDTVFLTRLFKALEAADCQDLLFWRSEGDGFRFLLNCNDLFYWATADAEQVTPENVGVLGQVVRDLGAVQAKARAVNDKSSDHVAEAFTASLFAARVRGMRPQRACYEGFGPSLTVLFDACGPERAREDEG